MESIAIIGGGIIGLGIGWQLARENLPVHIFEQRHAGRQASWAAAGMLSPYCEASYNHSNTLKMGEQSLSLYPSFLKELREDTNQIVPHESEGTLCVAITRDDRAWLQRQYNFKKKRDMPVFWLSGEEVLQREPLLSPRVNAGIWIPSERQINNQLLVEAVKDAFLTRGGKLTENLKILEIVGKQGSHSPKIKTETELWHNATIVINTTGAWANELDPSLATSGIHIRPVKGQLLNLIMPSNLMLKGMIRSPRVYFAPKQDGIVRVGATSEDRGFNEDMTAGAAFEILENAREVIPAISEYAIKEIMVGFRPAIATNMPLIGPSSTSGVYHAIGHGRAGILLTPYTAYSMKKIIIEDLLNANST